MHKKVQKLPFFSIIFLNVDSSFNIINRLFKFALVIIDILMEGTVSQIFYPGLGLYFMSLRK